MTWHLLVTAIALPLLGAAQQQPPPKPNQINRPVIIPLRPRNEPPPPPKASPPPRTGITVPRPTTSAPRPNPSIGPSERRGASSDLSNWVKISPPALDLIFYMPQEPNEQRRTIRAGERELELVQYVVSMGDAGAYVVMHSELPADQGSNEANILQAARDRVVETLKGEIVGEERITAGDTTGLELQVQTPAEVVVRQRMFVKGSRFYQAIAAGPKDFATSTDADKYFRALRFQQSRER